jgi:hypothetical protein
MEIISLRSIKNVVFIMERLYASSEEEINFNILFR